MAHLNHLTTSNGVSRQFLNDTTIATSLANSRIAASYSHTASFNLSWEIDSTASLSVRSNANLDFDNDDGFNETFTTETFKGPVNKTNDHLFARQDNNFSRHSLNFFKWSQKKPGRNFNLSADVNLNGDNGNNFNEGI